jgi:hypothetical protein
MIANPIVLVDEIDKAAIGRQNGNLCNSLMPFMEVETSRKFPDPFIQAEVDLSNVSYVLMANDDTLLPAPLLDRLRIIRLPSPSIEHLPALARGIVSDIARERGGDARWWPNLEDGELAVAEELWPRRKRPSPAGRHRANIGVQRAETEELTRCLSRRSEKNATPISTAARSLRTSGSTMKNHGDGRG